MAKPASVRFLALCLGLLGVLVGGCVEPVGATRIVGPDGTPILHVHCGDEQVACFQLAGEQCPRGYFLSPIFDPHDGNFLVRCKDSARGASMASTAAPLPTRPAQAAALAAPAPAASASVIHPAAPEQGWPPGEVAKPSEPWPAPSAAAPVPKTAIGDVDLGY